MAKDPTLKKKRKSEALADETEAPVAPIAVPPVEGTASAEAVVAEVDAEKAAKKAKKEKRKSVGGEGELVDEKKVGIFYNLQAYCLQSESVEYGGPHQ